MYTASHATGRRSAGAATGRVAALVVLLSLAQAGCTLLPLGGNASGNPGGAPSPMGRGLRSYRIAFHCHSWLSHDSEVSFERIAAAAHRVGVNGVILSDHYEPGNMSKSPPPLVDGVLFIPGVELRYMGGSMMAFGFRDDFDKTSPRPELAERLREKGALIVAGHCEEIREWGELPLDGMEIYNLHAEFNQKSALSILWRFLFLLPDCFFESSITVPKANLETWDRLLSAGDRLFPLLGCDAHENIRLFGPLGGVIGSYPELLRLFSNHVLARDLREDLILDALRNGRVYGVFDYLGDSSGFSMSYGREASEAGGRRAILGEHATFDEASVLDVRVPLKSTLRVLRNGRLHRELVGTAFRERLPGAGVYRVEVYRGKRLWILPAPLYLDEPATGAGLGPADGRSKVVTKT